FHTGGDVHRVAPHIVEKFSSADEAGHYRAACDAKADRHATSSRINQAPRGVAQVERELPQRLRVVGPRRRTAAHRHVGVARGLDLFEPVALHRLSKSVKTRLK